MKIELRSLQTQLCRLVFAAAALACVLSALGTPLVAQSLQA
jgi:hypothetical protein